MRLDDVPTLEKNIKHDIDVSRYRLVIRDGMRQRLTDSVERRWND